MKKLFPILGLALFAACNSSVQNKDESAKDLLLESPPAPQSPKAEEKTPSGKAVADTAGFSFQFSQNAPVKNVDWDKKIIKTAFLKLEVKDFKSYSGLVRKTAKQYGGYVANEEQNQSEEKIESIISIKVPVDQFEAIMEQLPSGAEKVVERKITTDDVTGEVVDIKSRLEARAQMRLKYLEFLKQSKNMQEVLSVQSEINALQEEIESASGRVNYLAHQSAYSTINITYYQPLAGYNPSNDQPGFFTRTVAAFKSGFSSIAEIIIGVISIWPFLLLAFCGWFLLKKYRNGIFVNKQKA